MAKRFDNEKNQKKYQKTITRNWIICGVSAALIIILTIASRMSA